MPEGRYQQKVPSKSVHNMDGSSCYQMRNIRKKVFFKDSLIQDAPNSKSFLWGQTACIYIFIFV